MNTQKNNDLRNDASKKIILDLSTNEVENEKIEIEPTVEESNKDNIDSSQFTYSNTNAETSSNSTFYVFDLLKRAFSLDNIPLIIYLILNLLFITMVFGMMFGATKESFVESFFTALVVYMISLTLALSPLGEWILRITNGCKSLDEDEINILEPLFNEVYKKAKVANPSLPDGIKLFIKDDMCRNAFATGRKTICVTQGLLLDDDEVIKAALGHEFGHLAHKDTDLILLVSVGNMIFTAMILFIKMIIWFFQIAFAVAGIFVGKNTVELLTAMVCGTLSMILVSFTTWLWTKIGFLLVMQSSRGKEYLADEFAFNLEYGDGLCKLLNSFRGAPEKGLFANLVSSHPSSKKRLERLQKLGCECEMDYI